MVRTRQVDEAKIVRVAYRLFRQRGIHSTTLQQVVRACNARSADIHLIFKSKHELVLAVIRYAVNRKMIHLSIASSLAPSAIAELRNFLQFVDETLTTLGAGVLDELAKDHRLTLDQLQDLVDDRMMPYLKKNIKRGLSEGFYRKGLNAELHAATYFYLLRTLLESRRGWTRTRKIVAHFNDIFFYGVLNVKGMQVHGVTWERKY
ncbi:MAG TPA: TetR/AcrR family transcriptional regulator [Cyclobacteriaceae bacterium]|nr:TetR/AcrR family transcriptional regulator [Cyclobacteriaceae bacterium]